MLAEEEDGFRAWWAPYVPIPAILVIDYLQRRYLWDIFGRMSAIVVGKGNQFGRFGYMAVVLLFFIDDFGTARGFQAEDDPQEMYEGNPHMSLLLDKSNELFGVTHSTMRVFFFEIQAIIFAIHKFSYATPYIRLWILLMGVSKAWGGYRWWFLEPNNFSFLELFYKGGRETPQRMFHLRPAPPDPFQPFSGEPSYMSRTGQHSRRNLIENTSMLKNLNHYILFP